MTDQTDAIEDIFNIEISECGKFIRVSINETPTTLTRAQWSGKIAKPASFRLVDVATEPRVRNIGEPA